MKLATWNVNGIRAIWQKGFADIVKENNADVIALQEIKFHAIDDEFHIDGYKLYDFPAERKGYSGTAVYVKKEPISIAYGIGIEEFDSEGRTLILEYEDFYFINSYTPNAGEELKRMDYKLSYNEALLQKMEELRKIKPCVLTGDLNVAHKEIDLKNPKTNTKNAGFTPEERESFTRLLSHGYVDVFRHFYPDLEDAYTWWSYRFKARDRNVGWRIDYFVTTKGFEDRVESIKIRSDIFGSDHCPVVMTLKK